MTDISPREGHAEGHSAPAKLGYSPVADIPHKPRATDTDPKAARRAERQVAAMFLLSMVFVVLFVVAYVTIDATAIVYIPVLGSVGASNVALGFTMGAAIFLIGAGAIQWAKKLMPDVEVVQQRHDQASPRSATAEAVANYERGKDESGFARFKLIRRTLIGALVLFPIPLVVVLRDLWTPDEVEAGKSPADILSTTLWTDGLRIVSDGTYAPVRPEDLPVGGLISAIPENLRRWRRSPTTSTPEARPRSSWCAWIPARSAPSRATAGTTRGSSLTRRSAPTWAARSPCTSSAPITCCAPATSRPSTLPMPGTSSSARPRDACRSCRSAWMRKAIS
jgi:ubiquinol-cytochrome c reductase iron-sulfur subunit